MKLRRFLSLFWLFGFATANAGADPSTLPLFDEMLAGVATLEPAAATCGGVRESQPAESAPRADACEDFYKFACADETKASPATAELSKSEWEARLVRAKEEAGPAARTEFTKTLMGANGPKILKLIPNDLLPNLPECSAARKTLSVACRNRLAQALTDISLRFVDADSSRGSGMNRLAYNYGLTQRLFESPLLAPTYRKIESGVESKMRDVDLEKKIVGDTFTKVKSILIRKIQTEANPSDRDALIAKINSVKDTGFSCYGLSYLKSFRREGAAYMSEATPNTFGFCGGNLFGTGSELRAAQIIAHELSHAIDPCNFPSRPFDSKDREEREKNYAFPEVVGCLRGENSIAAGYNSYIFEANSPKNLSPNPRDPKKIFCYTDQLSEAFPDWMAAEVLPELIADTPNLAALDTDGKRKALAGIFSGSSLCTSKPSAAEIEAELYGELRFPHPSGARRMNGLLAANPRVRALMGCDPKKPGRFTYCGKDTPPADWGARYTPVLRRGNRITLPTLESLRTDGRTSSSRCH